MGFNSTARGSGEPQRYVEYHANDARIGPKNAIKNPPHVSHTNTRSTP